MLDGFTRTLPRKSHSRNWGKKRCSRIGHDADKIMDRCIGLKPYNEWNHYVVPILMFLMLVFPLSAVMYRVFFRNYSKQYMNLIILILGSICILYGLNLISDPETTDFIGVFLIIMGCLAIFLMLACII